MDLDRLAIEFRTLRRDVDLLKSGSVTSQVAVPVDGDSIAEKLVGLLEPIAARLSDIETRIDKLETVRPAEPASAPAPLDADGTGEGNHGDDQGRG